jgi:hypothetical protein
MWKTSTWKTKENMDNLKIYLRETGFEGGG